MHQQGAASFKCTVEVAQPSWASLLTTWRGVPTRLQELVEDVLPWRDNRALASLAARFFISLKVAVVVDSIDVDHTEALLIARQCSTASGVGVCQVSERTDMVAVFRKACNFVVRRRRI